MKHIWILNACIAALMAVCAVATFTTRSWPYGFIDVALFVVNVGVGVWSYKRTRRTSDSHWTATSGNSNPQARGGTKHMGAAGQSKVAATSPGTGVEQSEPIRAWRGINFTASGSSVLMSGGHGPIVAGEQPKAICASGQPHHAPDWNCTCGYYAVKDLDDARPYGFLAEVDLYGTVIEHDAGYRAEYMRVLSLRIPRSFCSGKFLCQGTPEMVVFPEQVEYQNPYPAGGSMMYYQPPTYYTPSPMAVCTDCASTYERVASLQQIAARLGCEVRWEDEPAHQLPALNPAQSA